MWPRFGIKIGNSTICVASSKEDGKVEVVANKHGNRVSHAVLLADSDEMEVGLTAKQKLTSKGMCSVVNNFQLMATDLSDEQIERACDYLTCRFSVEDGKYELQKAPVPGSDDQPDEIRFLTPYEVCVQFFKASFELARQCHILEEHPNIVLAAPHHYSQSSWSSIARAAEEAGFHVAQVIPEHTAAVSAYDHLLAREATPKRVLCIKSGGLLTSVSLFSIEDGLISLLGSQGPYYIGGKQFTDVLKEFICTEFFKKYKLDASESRRSIAKVQTAAEDCKHILTTLPSTQIYIDSLMDGIDFNLQMSRARYEMLIQPVLNEFLSTVNQAVDDILASLTDDDKVTPIDEIVIAGGTMKIPKIQSVISSRFPDAKVNCSLSPDEVVAIGCATQSLYIDADGIEDDHDTRTKSEMHCSCIDADIYLAPADDTSKQQLVFEKGSLLPIETVVELNDTSDDDATARPAKFYVKMGESSGEICVANTKCVDGVIRVKAVVENVDGRPKMTLLSAAT